MKKVFIMLLLCLSLLLTGCGKNGEKDVIKNFEKKVNGADSYHIVGVLDITNNDDTYTYDVDVSYKKDDNYRVSLTNKSNGHEQIILKNSSGVYVVTPSLNKSFKFQSDWPNNNSQIYLLKAILNDIENDDEKTFEEKDGLYVFTTSVNYPNNTRLSKQNIKIDKNYLIKEVEIVDEAGIPQMVMKFNEVDLKADFDDKHFQLDNIIENVEDNNNETNSNNESDNNKGEQSNKEGNGTNNQTNTKDDESSNSQSNTSNENSTNETSDKDKNGTNNNATQSSSIEDIIFPLYIPTGTTLTDQEKVDKTNGERVILTFDGEKPFLLVEETASVEEEFSIIPTYGEPFMLADTVGALTSNSITWASNGVEYYLVSDAMSQLELIEIASSISSIPTMK